MDGFAWCLENSWLEMGKCVAKKNLELELKIQLSMWFYQTNMLLLVTNIL
jgi:hypothetical protein